MSRQLRYLWLDLETTGTDAANDSIIELGIVVTDDQLNELDRGSWVINDGHALSNLKAAKTVVQEMHAASGLDVAVATGMTVVAAETLALGMMARHGRPHDFILAGSGVAHFDRRFLDAQMPRLAQSLKYYCIDVGILRRSVVLCGREDLLLPKVEKNHRALDDALLHLAELRHIKAALS